MKKPNVHTNWDRLRETWLGDVWPAHFYDDLAPEVRDAWYQITEWTKEDLNNIQKKLEELGVRVLRPYVDGPKENYLSKDNNISKGKLLRPPITPRDGNAVVGNNLYFGDQNLIHCYKFLLQEYDPKHIIRPSNTQPHISGANIVKLGKDLIIDKFIQPIKKREIEAGLTDKQKIQKTKEFVFQTYREFLKKEVATLGQDYRLHLATQGGHCDGAFMPLRNGLLISTQYFKDYDILFEGWEKIILGHPTYHDIGKNQHQIYWYVPGIDYVHPHFNEYIENNCRDWIGNFKETYFEVNILVIDEKNILCMGYHDALFKEFEKQGITCHVVQWRTRSFWDGGLHCITLDTIRDGDLVDYYPERGSMGLKQVASIQFGYSNEAFEKEYAYWLSTNAAGQM